MTWKDVLLVLSIAASVALVTVFVYAWWERKHRLKTSERISKEYAQKWVQEAYEENNKLDADELQNKLREKYGKKEEK